MKANELRIGNVVNRHKFEGDVVHVIDSKDIYIIENSDPKSVLYVKNYSPIPLTEEWLLRLGFVSNPYQDRYEYGDIDIECDKTKGETILWASGAPHIKYVHQVQNLIFALTGKELTLTEQ
jgi:hypothetical protein